MSAADDRPVSGLKHQQVKRYSWKLVGLRVDSSPASCEITGLVGDYWLKQILHAAPPHEDVSLLLSHSVRLEGGITKDIRSECFAADGKAFYS